MTTVTARSNCRHMISRQKNDQGGYPVGFPCEGLYCDTLVNIAEHMTKIYESFPKNKFVISDVSIGTTRTYVTQDSSLLIAWIPTDA